MAASPQPTVPYYNLSVVCYGLSVILTLVSLPCSIVNTINLNVKRKVEALLRVQNTCFLLIFWPLHSRTWSDCSRGCWGRAAVLCAPHRAPRQPRARPPCCVLRTDRPDRSCPDADLLADSGITSFPAVYSIYIVTQTLGDVSRGQHPVFAAPHDMLPASTTEYGSPVTVLACVCLTGGSQGAPVVSGY